MLLCSRTIDMNPIDLHRYKSQCDAKEATEEEDLVPSLKSVAQLVNFLNLIYLPYDPRSDLYEEKLVTATHILSKLWSHSDLFIYKSAESFYRW
ncbi:hypothetical protein BDF20DRAFT_883192 [Mycotypha africana]|uniref:uncharacterized protein n=1 Tax=Mycotypha africana TaxID=64632 RepID=UPI0023009B3A|nr:uncharacterized protein BDF20DRAFT_883192 [Mycotypha africana]KAI8973589.1 hypothetical protein BDF20DRAFT_883192 [Mycotypha africana]